jgi:ribosome-associated translation inhibitor RaiA
MKIPLDITFRGMATSPALVATINHWAAKLDAQFAIQRCAVTFEQPHKHRQHGVDFTIHVTVTIPGHEIAVRRAGSQGNPYVAVADAFRAARRQLIDVTAQRREARPAI